MDSSFFIKPDRNITVQDFNLIIQESKTGCVGEHFDYAWKILKENFLAYFLCAFVVSSVSIAINKIIPILGFFLTPSITYGLMIIVKKYQTLENYTISNYSDFVTQIIDGVSLQYKKIITLGITLLTYYFFVGVGTIFLIIPGIYAYFALSLADKIVFDKNCDFDVALRVSHTMFKQHFGFFVLFYLSLLGINFLGVCFFGVGVFITMPLTCLMTISLYYKLFSCNPI